MIFTGKKVKGFIFRKIINQKIDQEARISNSLEKMEVFTFRSLQRCLNLKIESGKFEKGENKILDSLKWKKGISNDIKSEKNQIIIVHIESILPPSIKSLSEVKGKVISEYQNELDKNWIKDLRQKYKYSVNYDVLYSIINK